MSRFNSSLIECLKMAMVGHFEPDLTKLWHVSESTARQVKSCFHDLWQRLEQGRPIARTPPENHDSDVRYGSATNLLQAVTALSYASPAAIESRNPCTSAKYRGLNNIALYSLDRRSTNIKGYSATQHSQATLTANTTTLATSCAPISSSSSVLQRNLAQLNVNNTTCSYGPNEHQRR